ncbi:chemotaxis protein CheW [Oceanicoccus sagamiensis]|uniref:CheW-like domain-containing protein n=1 Tax=Oceanicoccus sagamiensis TaxID=716816 RepID=A0A1X9NBW1_9GAMM|nr:chemotaxis protein CheW [Oceanicoccus sagamiensis]ARN74661.1 hypothetical protein BST96_11320 [Oceanicoccus sagamiensis]
MSEWIDTNVGQYLNFELDDTLYGINIRSIKEVLDLCEITPLPSSADYLRGVINLRGQVVPVIDLKLRFGLAVTEMTVDTCILILEIKDSQGELFLLGALADSVREVIDLSASDIDPPPQVGSSVNSAFIYGVGQHDGAFVVLLDAQSLSSHDDLEAIKVAASVVGPEGESVDEHCHEEGVASYE